MRSTLFVLILAGCAATQAREVRETPTVTCPAPPPPPAPPLDRAASSFFEAGDIADWAERARAVGPPPNRAALLETITDLLEVTREAERTAADARVYAAAEDARSSGEELLLLVVELGAELPEGYSLPEPEIDELRPGQGRGERADIGQTLDDIASFADEVKQVLISVIEALEEEAPSRAERKIAGCYRQRLWAYDDLQSVASGIQEDLASLRVEILDSESRLEVRRLERELGFVTGLMDGCRRGNAEIEQAARRALEGGAEEIESLGIADLAADVIELCG
jgi:hypothetical protein